MYGNVAAMILRDGCKLLLLRGAYRTGRGQVGWIRPPDRHSCRAMQLCLVPHFQEKMVARQSAHGPGSTLQLFNLSLSQPRIWVLQCSLGLYENSYEEINSPPGGRACKVDDIALLDGSGPGLDVSRGTKALQF